MRRRTLMVLLFVIFIDAVPLSLVRAATLTSVTRAEFIGVPTIPDVGYGTYQTALKAGDTASFLVLLHSPFVYSPVVSADLSELITGSSTVTVPAGPGSPNYNSDSYYVFGPFTIGSNITDGLKTITVRAVDFIGEIATTTAHIVVDNVPPVITLSSITFSTSTTSPRAGDYMYLSGRASGTGSKMRTSGLFEGLFDANGNSLSWYARFTGDMIAYDARAFDDALASSTDGTFTNIPIKLSESDDPGQIARATTFRVHITVYDEAGNTSSTMLSVPVPKPAPQDPCIAAGNCASNVMFLPGIEASRLYRSDGQGGDKKLWEPGLMDSLQDLHLTPEGRSIRGDIYTKTGDIIDEMPVTGANVYKSFIAKMNDLRDTQHLINAWEAGPYDWRLSLDDILAYGKQTDGHISYLAATSTPYIIQELKHLAATSKTGKVTIVAHSNGGLVAKRLTELLGADASKLIDKMIFVAVPQAGTPAAIAADLHGYDQDFGYGLIVSKSAARTSASTSPMAYNLLPSTRYFTQVDTPVISFDTSLPDWVARYGSVIHSSESLRAFLTDSFGRVDSRVGDINQPIQMSGTLLSNAEAMHSDLDNWTPPSGVQLTQIAGWGVPKTVSGIIYKKDWTGVVPQPEFTVDGDGTVVVPSALWASTTTGAIDYWVDLKRYSNDHWLETLGGRNPFNHASILETNPALAFVSDRIIGIIKPLSDYVYLSTEAPIASDKRLRYALHSPLSLNLYDMEGRHTGVSTTTGKIEEQIPGTYYTEFGEAKYLFSDSSTNAKVVMNGYAPGTFTFNVDQYSGDTLTASTTFKDIPTTASTTVSVDIQSDISTLSSMKIDKNSDGVVDAVLVPKLNDTVMLDSTPPEMRVTFSTTTKSINIIGSDDSGSVTVVSTTTYPILKKNQKEKEHQEAPVTTVTASDASGNTTALVYTRKGHEEHEEKITLQSLVYNGATTTFSSSLSYEWEVSKKGVFQEFESTLRIASTTLESKFQQKKNTTAFVTRLRDIADDEKRGPEMQKGRLILPGMVISYIESKKGDLIIGY